MQLYINNWSSTLSLPATASAAQLSVPEADAALLVGLGAGDYYLATLAQVDANGNEVAWEIVRITANTAGVLDVLRGQEGTTALDLEAGTAISARLTRATMESLRDSGGPALSDAPPQALGTASAGTSPEASRDDHVHPLPTPAAIGAATSAQGAKADSAVQPGALAAVATSGSYADLTDKPFIPTTPGDIGAASAAQGDLADTAVQPAALTAALADKVDKVTGKQLSTEDYTTAEKTKLAGLDEAHYKGTYTNLAALQAAHPTASAGDYADVDAGVADPVLRYIWDNSDSEWVAQAGSADPITAAQVKTLYESNADTNAYTNAEKAKLGGVASGATANADTDSLPESGTPTNKWFTEARVRAAVLAGLSLADSAAVTAADTVLQAIGKLAARLATAFDRANHTGEQAISTVTGLDAALAARLQLAGIPYRVVTASGAITPADAGHMIISTSATPITLTIGAEATAAWTASGLAPLVHFLQDAAGAVTVTGDGFTVDVATTDTNVLDGEIAAATAVWRGTDSWRMFGRLVAA